MKRGFNNLGLAWKCSLVLLEERAPDFGQTFSYILPHKIPTIIIVLPPALPVILRKFINLLSIFSPMLAAALGCTNIH